MKLPKYIRKLGSISIPIFLASLAVTVILVFIFPKDWSGLETMVIDALTAVVVISFITMTGSIIAAPLARNIENAILLQFGQPATATVLETLDVTSGSGPRGRAYLGTRFKLDVHPSSGGPFTAVAEEVLRGMTFINAGDTVSVKYDPRTKEAALVTPKKIKMKSADF